MEKKPERKGLGRGLSALMADVNLSNDAGANNASALSSADTMIPIESIRPNPDQPRRDFDASALEELAESIKAKGIIQPLVVRPISPPGSYEIVAGERRWRASQMAQLHRVPVVIREFTDEEVIEVAIIENIQRQDLSAIEEAMAFSQLMERFGHTQEKLAEALSKSRSHIANTIRLLTLPEGVQNLVRTGKLSAGHARTLIGAPDPMSLALKVITQGLSVRETEKLARQVVPKKPGGPKSGKSAGKDADTRAIEADLSANLGMGVSIDHGVGGEGGTLKIKYRSLDQLDQLCQVLSVIPRDLKN
ncbi:ParB/RepB/Spo0J family partition protein [Thioclava sp. FR2]|uniref:ParB/RepB/Spo0J family partition protein n=1 Tax=Thioclava sp. FR2 TaxID=3445780 RepID=UPI003EB6BAD5